MFPCIPKKAIFTDEKIFSNLKIWNIDELVCNQQISVTSPNMIYVSRNQFEELEAKDKQVFFEVGVIYYLKKRYQRAIAWLWGAAVNNHVDAQYMLAHIIHNGIGVPVNEDDAKCWSINQNETSTDYQKELPKAFFDVAEKQNAALCYYVASLFDSSFYLHNTSSKAMEWYQASAALNHEEAEYKLKDIKQDLPDLKLKTICLVNLMTTFFNATKDPNEKRVILEMIYKQSQTALASLLKSPKIAQSNALLKKISEMSLEITNLKKKIQVLSEKKTKYKSSLKHSREMGSSMKQFEQYQATVKAYESTITELKEQLALLNSDHSSLMKSISSVEKAGQVTDFY